MKNLLVLICIAGLFACESKKELTQEVGSNQIDVEAELAAIEETRSAFQLAIKEGRFADLKKYGTSDVISLTTSCGAWAPFKALSANPKGEFHYDSLVMKPKETIIVSDSVAYDFGTSSTFYTNENGELVELNATFLAVLKKDKKDGIWKLHREVANERELDKNKIKYS